MKKLKVIMAMANIVMLVTIVGMLVSMVLSNELPSYAVFACCAALSVVAAGVYMYCENRIRKQIGVEFSKGKPKGNRILACVDYGHGEWYDILYLHENGYYYDSSGEEVPESCIKEYAEF